MTKNRKTTVIALGGPSDSTDQQPLYEQVAGSIVALIDSGALRPGERIPSVRRIHQQQKVSISTAVQAYRVLESRGLIEARPQSGYYVRIKPWVVPPEPVMVRPASKPTQVRVSELVMEVIQSVRDPGMVRLGATLPSPELFPTLELNRIMGAAGRRSPHLANSYVPPPGHHPLRVQIAKRALEYGCVVSPDDIVVTCGATEALNLCLRAVANPGDTIAIQSPTYFGFLQIIEALGMRACEIPTFPRDGVCLDELKARLDRCGIKACLFATNFSNPLGCHMPDTKKKALAELLAERDVPLIEDDLSGSLGFGPHRPKTVKAFDRHGLVMLVDSFTKTLAPGLRVGWVIPGRFQKRVEHLKFTASSATATLPQMAIADYLANTCYDHHLRKIRRFYAGQAVNVTETISRTFPPGTRVSRPQGGQVLWVELPEGFDSVELYRRALTHKISIAPGAIFSPTQKYANCIRMNLGNPWNDTVRNAIETVGNLAKELIIG